MAQGKIGYDYRAARDWVFGIRRNGEKILSYEPTPATRSERMLLLALIEFAPNIEPSTAALAHMLATDERVVRRLLAAAETKGLIRVQRRSGARSRYVLTCDDPGRNDRGTPTPDVASPGRHVLPPRTSCPLTPDVTSPKADNEADKKADKISAPTSDAGSFALEHPGSKPEPERKPKTRRPRKTSAPSENGLAHKQVVDCYFEAFRAKNGQDPIFEGYEGKAVQKLLDRLKGNADEACRRIRIGFAQTWRSSLVIQDIATKPDSFVSAEPPRKAAVDVQRGGLDDEYLSQRRIGGAE